MSFYNVSLHQRQFREAAPQRVGLASLAVDRPNKYGSLRSQSMDQINMAHYARIGTKHNKTQHKIYVKVRFLLGTYRQQRDAKNRVTGMGLKYWKK